jgi:hypothetical protein
MDQNARRVVGSSGVGNHWTTTGRTQERVSEGIRTPDPGAITSCDTKTDDPPEGACCTAGCTNRPETASEPGEMPDDLAAVVAAWESLPELMRAGIVAMVRQTVGSKSPNDDTR